MSSPVSSVGGGVPADRRHTPVLTKTAKRLALLLAGLVGIAVGWQLLSGDSPTGAAGAKVHVDQARGIRLSHPGDWRLTRRGSDTRIASPGRAMVIVLNSPTAGVFTAQARRDTERAIMAAYGPGKVVGRPLGWLGKRRVRSTEMLVSMPSGEPARVLTMAAANRWRTYTVTLFSALPPRASRLVEARRILNSIAFVKPRPKS